MSTTRSATPFSTVHGLMTTCEISLEKIVADPDHPRTECDPESITRLAESLRAHGQLQPIIVRWSGEQSKYVVVVGQRRWMAAIEAGLSRMAAVVFPKAPDDSHCLELQLIENALREDLSPIDQARAYRTLMDRNNWTARELAGSLHLHPSTVGRALALLNLPEPVQKEVEAGRIAPSLASEIGRLDDPDRQCALAERVVAEGLSRAETAQAVRDLIAPSPVVIPPLRRVFTTSLGRVTVELDPGQDQGDEAILATLLEALQTLQAERPAPTTPPEPEPKPEPEPEPAPVAENRSLVAPGNPIASASPPAPATPAAAVVVPNPTPRPSARPMVERTPESGPLDLSRHRAMFRGS